MIPPRKRLQLLEELPRNAALRQLIAYWPNVPRPDDLEWLSDARARAQVKREWSQLAGVSTFVIQGLWKKLFGNAMVRPDGTVDEAVDLHILQGMIEGAPLGFRNVIERQIEEAKARAKAAEAATKGAT